MISAIVLSAGLSSRMGTANKLLLPYKNKTVVEHVVENILEAGIAEVIVVTGHEAALIKSCLGALPVVFIHNRDYTSGMTSSIQHGINAAKGNGYMICLSDMVTITSAEYRLLENFFENSFAADPACICIPLHKNKKGNPVLFSAFYKDAILQNLEPEGCKNIVQSNKEHIYTVNMPTPHVLQDFDNPADYQKLESI